MTSQDGATSTVIDCAVTGEQHRGFFLHSGETNAVISGLTIQNGSEYGSGGAISVSGAGVTVLDCILRNNAANDGGGISLTSGGSLTVMDCALSGNTAVYGGGGIYVATAGPVSVTACSLTANAAAFGTAGIDSASSPPGGTLILTDDILWGDTRGEVNTNTPPTASYCDIQGGYAGAGNISVDPRFVAPTNLHLQAGSPCLGAGTNTVGTTLDGHMRPAPPSIGAYELGGPGTATSVTLASSPNPSAFGQSVTFTATVAGAGGTPTGAVTFTVDGSAQTPVGLSGGTAALTVPAYGTANIPAGSHRITASYGGDPVFAPSVSAALTQIVNPPLNTVVTLASSLNPSAFGQSVTFTATVAGDGGTPTGTVTFTADGTAQPPVTLSGGTAAYTTAALMAYPQSVTAAYSGDRFFAPSVSAVLTQTVSQAATTTALSSSLDPSVTGQSVRLSAVVTGGDLAGNVTLTDTTLGVSLGTGRLSGGVTSVTVTGLALGVHQVVAHYSGDINSLPGVSPTLMQTVNPHLSPQYVSPSGSDAAAGTQAAPKRTIQAAINATVSGDAVIVGDGTYTGAGNTDLDFGGRNISVTYQNGAATTTIDCQGSSSANHRGFTLHSREKGALIAGLTIRNGFEGDGGSVSGSGGGIYLSGVRATVQGCRLIGNSAAYGGGLYIVNSGTAAGTSAITNCTAAANSAGSGAGMYVENDIGTLTVGGCAFLGNAAGSVGGGLYAVGYGSTVAVSGCTFQSNSAVITGGGVYDSNSSGGKTTAGRTALTNCTFTGNTAAYGSGIDDDNADGASVITNCTLTGNAANKPGGGSLSGYNTTLTNDILWGDNSGEVSANTPVTASYCDIQGGYAGAGNISSDPLFVGYVNLHLQAGSPCLGAGTDVGAPPADFDGSPRRDPPSLGAYEYAFLPPTAAAQSVTTAQDAAVALTLSGADPNGLALAYAVATGPAHGTLSGTAPNLFFTPAAGYSGPDDFTFTVGNGFAQSAPAAVSITVSPLVLSALTFPSPVPGGTVVIATVTLSAVTRSDVVVGLSSSDTSVVRLFRAVVIPAGSSSATFAINTYRSHVTRTVTIRATLGQVIQAQDLTITGR